MKRISPNTLGLYSLFLAQGPNCSRPILVSTSTRNCSTLFNRFGSLPNNKSRNFYLSSASFNGTPVVATATSSKSVQDLEASVENESSKVVETESDIGISGSDVESLLSYAATRNFSVKVNSTIFSSLGQCVSNSDDPEAERAKILADPRFEDICTVLRNAEFTSNPQFLLQALRGCMNIGMPEENDLRKYLENELKWVVRRCPIKIVAKAIGIFSSASAPSRLSKFSTKLNSSHPLLVAVDSLQRRWVEVTTGGDFIATFAISSQLNKATRAKIEDRAVELVQEFSSMEMIKIFIALGSQKRRPTPLLRALAFHLSKYTDKISVRDWIELMYAMNELSFCEPVIMSRMCSEIAPELDAVTSSSLVSSLVTSLGQMRYKHTDVIVALDDWISKHDDQLRPFDRAAWLLTSATLNIRTENTEKFCGSVKKVLTKETTKNPLSWVNIVHSLLVLEQGDPELLSSVLEPAFVSTVDEIGKKADGAKLKILNINGATTKLVGYKGASLDKGVLEKWTSDLVGSTDGKLTESVVESLSNFLPPPKYLQPSKQLPSGVYIDAICKVNEKLDAVPVDTDKGTNVAFRVQGFPTYTTGIKEPTGLEALNVRLLQSEGYAVVQVPYHEYTPQEKLIRRVQYLEQKLRSLNDGPQGTNR